MHHSPCDETTHSSIALEFERLEFLAVGKSGIVYGIDEERILKEYHGEENEMDVERRAFTRLGPHANIVRYLSATGNGSIILERGQPLRTIIQQTGADQIPLDRKRRWLSGAAEGMRYLHENGIIHADTGCHNMILVQDCLKIIDFEGCSIDGEEATSCYEWFSYQESIPPISRTTDIFAYGCAVYEIITGRPPHHELETSNDPKRLAKRLYAEKRFPEVTDLPLAGLMQGCWHGAFGSMSEVLQALEAAGLPKTCRVDTRHSAFYLLDLMAKVFGVFWR
ncbi:MAG: hypothetical protein M1837_002332 [Sclerophora amabilis]|nr:MAG: hypothetical protein M1837_002332 [Sclerophora amabilis]